FAEAVACNVIGFADFHAQDFPCRDGHRDERGLRVFGELELIVGAFETEFREGEAEGVVGLFKSLAGGIEILSERLAHARELRALAGKKEGCLHPSAILAGLILLAVEVADGGPEARPAESGNESEERRPGQSLRGGVRGVDDAEVGEGFDYEWWDAEDHGG